MTPIEHTTTVQPGRYYDVPCVYAAWSDFAPRWLVVHGSWHEDTQYLDFEEHHYHLDPRFVPREIFDRELLQHVFSRPIHTRYDGCEWLNLDLTVARKRRKCLREMPDIPQLRRGGLNTSLRDAFLGARLLKGDVCPHKGYSLKAIKPDAAGRRQCPLHGLLFDQEGVCIG